MTVPAPKVAKSPRGQPEGRWRWWYASIADYRIQNPGCTNEQIANHLGKHPNTIAIITNTDLYKEFEAQRMDEHRALADAELRHRLIRVATKSLDIIEVQLDKKKDQVPLGLAKDLAIETLDRLGFAPQKGPNVAVNVATQANVVIPSAVTPAALDEARAALRAVEQRRLDDVSTEVLQLEVERPSGLSPVERASSDRAREASEESDGSSESLS